MPRSRRVRDAGRLCTSFDPSVYSGSNPERLFSSLEEESKGFDFVRTENRPHYAHDAACCFWGVQQKRQSHPERSFKNSASAESKGARCRPARNIVRLRAD